MECERFFQDFLAADRNLFLRPAKILTRLCLARAQGRESCLISQAQTIKSIQRHYSAKSFDSLSSSSDAVQQSTHLPLTTMKPATLRPFLPRPAIRRRFFFARNYAIQAPGSPTLQVFNRHTKYLQKERAASNVKRSRETDYMKDEVAMRLAERLLVNTPQTLHSRRPSNISRISIDISPTSLTLAQMPAT